MTIFSRPTPTIIGSSGGGSNIATGDTSVAISSNTDGNVVVISTGNTQAMLVDRSQNIQIGTPVGNSSQRLVVSSNTGNALALVYGSTSSQAVFNVSPIGALTIRSSGQVIDMLSNQINLDLNAIMINGSIVNASANQLNYTMATPGSATPFRALVFDASSNIAGINNLSAATIAGTLSTPYQPTINRVTSLNIDSTLALNGINVSSSASQLNYVNITPGTSSANKALILDSGLNIAGINNLSATRLIGQLQTAAQPLITSLGILSTLRTSGSVGVGVGSGSPGANLEVFSASNPVIKLNNGIRSANISIDTNGNLKLNADGDIIVQTNKSIQMSGTAQITGLLRVTATNLNGRLETAAQPNITSVGQLTTLNTSGAVGIGTSTPNNQLEVRKSDGNCLRISRDGSFYTDMNVDSSGNLQLLPIGDVLLGLATSIRLTSGNITGVDSLVASTLTGAIQTGPQPNITSVGTLGSLAVSNGITAASVSASTITGTIQTAAQPNITTVGTLGSLAVSNGITAASVSATTVSGTIQTADQPNITSIGAQTNLTVSNTLTVGTVSATDINGTIQTANQSNITTIGQLFTLGVSGAITAGSVSASTLTGAIQTASQPLITTIGTLGSLAVSNGITAASVSASTITGTIQTASQTLITTVGTLVGLSTGDIGINLTGPTYNLDINTTGQVLRASMGEVEFDITMNSSGDCILTTQGNGHLILANGTGLQFSGGGAISGLTTLTTTNLIGTIQTAAQPGITSVGTFHTFDMDSASVLTMDTNSQLNMGAGGSITIGLGGGLSIGSTTVGQTELTYLTSITKGTAAASKALVLDIDRNVSNINSLSASQLTGQIQTAAQPNITQIGALSSITLGSTSFAETDFASIHSVVAGTASASKALILNSSSNISGINSLGTSTLILGGSTLSSTQADYLTSITIGTASASKALVLDSSLNIHGLNAIALGSSSIDSNYNISADSAIFGVSAKSYANSNQFRALTCSTATLNNSTTASSSVDNNHQSYIFVGAPILTASNTSVTTANASSLYVVGAPVAGTNMTIANAYSIYVANGTAYFGGNVSMAGTIFTNTQAGYLNNITPGTASAGKALVLDSNLDISGINSISTSSLTVSGSTIDSSTFAYVSGVSAGTASAGKALVLDSNLDISGINSISTSSLTINGNTIDSSTFAYVSGVSAGTASAGKALVLDANKDIASIRNLSTVGLVGIGTGPQTQQLEVNSITGDCMRLSYNRAISASNYATLAVSAGGNLTITSSGGATNVPQLTSNQIILGTPGNSTMPLEVGSVAFVMTSAYAYNTNTNAHGTISAGGSTSYNYSIRTTGRILCAQSVDVASDRRLKYNVKELDEDFCMRFVENTTPVSFNWITGDSAPSYGYIAQDLLRNGFDDLVNLAEDQNMVQEIDSDGLISPQGIRFTVSYQHIIPILALNQKKLMQDNKDLSDKVDKLMAIIEQLTRDNA